MTKPTRKYSLDTQIAEVKRELAKRSQVYPREVAKGAMRQAEADMHVDIMRGVQATLEWMKEHETTLRAAVKRKESASS